MSKFLLDYFMPVTAITPTAQASTDFLKQACVVVLPKVGVTPGVIHECSTNAEIAAVTDNVEAQQLLAAGMGRVYILPMNDLGLATALEGHESDFYTLLISSDFDDDDIIATQAEGIFTVSSYANLLTTTPDTVTVGATVFTAQSGAVTPGTATFRAATSNDATAASLAAQINAHPVASLLVVATVVNAIVTVKAIETGTGGNAIAAAYADLGGGNIGGAWTGLSGGFLAGGDGLFLGEFEGVVGVSSDDDDFLADQAAITNRCAFHVLAANGAKNMMYAFGKLLSNQFTWANQQYVSMPLADDIDNKGDAEALWTDKISFVIDDDEQGIRLGLFACGKKAIFAPYVIKNLIVDMQSAGLAWVSGNQPAYSVKNASLLETVLQAVGDDYIADNLITDVTVDVSLSGDGFSVDSDINTAEPKAMWRNFVQLRQTL